MKKMQVLLLSMMIVIIMLPITAHASDMVEINTVNFPDDNFRNYVEEYCDINGDMHLSITEIQDITTIDVTDKEIYSLKGIEFFTELDTLSCDNNKITQLDISSNKILENLFCDYNQLSELNLVNNSELKNLNCSNNQLKGLDLSKNLNLVDLQCSENKLEKLNVCNNKALQTVLCYNNSLTKLDFYNNKELSWVDCSNNLLSVLNVNGSDKLEILTCLNNELEYLDVTENSGLILLNCGNNKLKSLNVQYNPLLTGIFCVNNALTELNLDHNLELRNIYCYGNQLTKLDISKNGQILELSCWNNRLKMLDLSGNAKLEYLYCNQNQLTELDVSKQSKLIDLNCSENYLNKLLLNENAPLHIFLCGGNHLTELSDLPESITNLNGNTQKVYTKINKTEEGWILDFTKLMAPENLVKVELESDIWNYNSKTGEAVCTYDSFDSVPVALTYYYMGYPNGMQVQLFFSPEFECVVMKENEERAAVNGLISLTTQYESGYAKMENINGTMQIPLRYIAEVNGLDVDYDLDTSKTKVSNPITGEYIIITPGSALVTKYSVTGEKLFAGQAPLAFTNQNGITMGPLRFTCEVLGLNVIYQETTHGNYVVISQAEKTEEEAFVKIEEAFQLGL